jgi:hypothetical protein
MPIAKLTKAQLLKEKKRPSAFFCLETQKDLHGAAGDWDTSATVLVYSHVARQPPLRAGPRP